MIADSLSISLFVDVYKGAGRNPISGKKKGGLKIHTKLPLGGTVPDLIHITEAACNDKSFLGQLEGEKGTIYVFDKGYVKYQKWKVWSKNGVYFVPRLNDNADYQVLEGKPNHISDYAEGGDSLRSDYPVKPIKGTSKGQIDQIQRPCKRKGT